MDPTRSLADARLIGFLEEEPVLWLSTVGPDGAPNLVPTWFVWDGTRIVVVSKAGARKARNIAADPRVMVALGDAEADFDVGMLEARARLRPATAVPILPEGFAAKYGDRIAALGLTLTQFAATYPQVIEIVPTRALGWHGRSTPATVMDAARVVAAHGQASILEPWRTAVRGLLGEPLARPIGA
jgi:PPOX class probable F420-dependent enzyme